MSDTDRDKRFEDYPLSRKEYISAMVHFYRGELNRANTWRLRLDNTTNWAVISIMGLLSFAFGINTASDGNQSHGTIIIGMLILLHFLTLEARRYRFFDVWRSRLRMIEENFYGPILTRELYSPAGNWGDLVAGDLLHPKFKISRFQAIRARLLRNYLPLFIVLFIAWVAKLVAYPAPEGSPWYHAMAMYYFPWQVSFAIVTLIYSFILYLVIFVEPVDAPELEHWEGDIYHGHIKDF